MNEERRDGMTLTKWNLLNRDVVGIHGVAMNAEQAKKFKALVWCPASNYFLLNKTADVNKLKNNTTICFGEIGPMISEFICGLREALLYLF